MVKKAIILVTIIALLVGVLCMPAFAATCQYLYTYKNDGVLLHSDGAYDIYNIKIPVENCLIRVLSGSTTIARSPTSGDPVVTASLKGDQKYTISYAMKADHLLWLDNLPSSVKVTLYWDVDCIGTVGYGTPRLRHFNNFYEYASPGDETTGLVEEYRAIDIDGTGRYPIDTVHYSVTVDRGVYDKGKDAVACQFGLQFYEFCPFDDSKYTFELTDLQLTLQVPVSISLQNQIDGINEEIDELPDEFGDEMQEVIDQERQEISSSADGAAGEMLEIIPDESQGFMNAVKSLVGAMSYDGTAAKLPIPPIKLPAIKGVMEEIKLTDKLEVDFGYWVNQLPGDVLSLVQIICTIALIVYCFKELYSTISYAMTLKGGASNE